MDRRASRWASIVSVVVLASVLVPGAQAGEPRELLPDLRMTRLRNLQIETTPTGAKLLRFGTIIVNVGEGPFELRGRRADTSRQLMQVRQRIYDENGGSRYAWTAAVMHYAGDGHDHWHVRKLERIELFAVESPDTVRRIAKRGYCFLDITPFNLRLPDAPQQRVYGESRCGEPNSLTVRPGLSIGWGDDYPWYFPYQWIVATGLPSGRYRLCVTADANGYFAELNEGNNWVWHDLDLDFDNDTVTHVGSSRTVPCRPPG